MELVYLQQAGYLFHLLLVSRDLGTVLQDVGDCFGPDETLLFQVFSFFFCLFFVLVQYLAYLPEHFLGAGIHFVLGIMDFYVIVDEEGSQHGCQDYDA